MTSKAPDIYDPVYVKDVFDKCSSNYILMSYICSFGFTERWRFQCVQALALDPRLTAQGYDMMAGTGEAWPHLLKRFPKIEKITAVDISSGMHKLAIERLHKTRESHIDFVEDDIFNSKIEPESADFIISTFGLKTFNPSQHAKFAKLVAQSLKKGAVFSMVEASDPKGWVLRPLYIFYLNKVLPLVERLILKGAQDFSNIGAYTARFSDARPFGDLLEQEGLEVTYTPLFFGCATMVSGRKPEKSVKPRPAKNLPDQN